MYTWRLNGFIALFKILWIYETHVCVFIYIYHARCRAHAISSSRMNLSFRHKCHTRISHLTWGWAAKQRQGVAKNKQRQLSSTKVDAAGSHEPYQTCRTTVFIYRHSLGRPMFSCFFQVYPLFSRSIIFSTGRSAQAEVLQKIQDDPKTEPRQNVAPDPQIP